LTNTIGQKEFKKNSSSRTGAKQRRVRSKGEKRRNISSSARKKAGEVEKKSERGQALKLS
jgi:hypothetical protein